MSTFLQLVQELHREVGAAGTAPSAVTGQVGEAARMVNWVISADYYIQMLWHNWKFLKHATGFSVSTVASTATLAKPTSHHFWDMETFKIDGGPLAAVEYEVMKADVLSTTEAQPGRVIIMPDNSLKFDPIPDDAYLITADYYLQPTKLAANADVSAIPLTYHQVILGRAMQLYANYEDAAEAKRQGTEIYDEFIQRLQDHQLPSQEYSQFKSTGNFIEVIAS
jgi:hypothetical protein